MFLVLMFTFKKPSVLFAFVEILFEYFSSGLCLSPHLGTWRSSWPRVPDAQADLSLRWAQKSFCWFCRAVAHIYIVLLCPLDAKLCPCTGNHNW